MKEKKSKNSHKIKFKIFFIRLSWIFIKNWVAIQNKRYIVALWGTSLASFLTTKIVTDWFKQQKWNRWRYLISIKHRFAHCWSRTVTSCSHICFLANVQLFYCQSYQYYTTDPYLDIELSPVTHTNASKN